ncbi:FadR/GntR family transcriptional regulator [Propionibacterium cyclohexanicum]|nr:FCD domain-containing protein [Propionibacterium cyclohexanicum]
MQAGRPMHIAIARELGIEIIDGRWATGSARTLDELQTRFTISRTVARESTRRLEAMGLVTSRRRLGLIPQPAHSWHVLDPELIDWRLHSSQREAQLVSLTQLRMAVEPAAAEMTARRAPLRVRAQLLPIAADMRRTGEAGQLRDFMTLDIEFHRLILGSGGNELFAALGDLVATVLQGRTELQLMPSQPKPEALRLHAEVAQAVFEGDHERARRAMQEILDEVASVFDAAERG